ncbi:MAG: tRNA preQ1(34) S-adenosylmethionine ribosyltransferase-isomerase QueA [Pyrinomonadaceae bacterium]|nr:tRNA preQ1(34) S-adenosylmethionine ribosyltransferase-isomerase QueA [Acidobacteriota bacterium]MBP7377228.1 tRNA preQ1(34) S-adenosylmethionine ribosyltransferase-isomerase QueA [Pyrinomonadaceae bacterium]
MRISEFDYELPPELIAQTAAERRDGSRMLVVDRTSGSFEDQSFTDLPVFVRSGDLIVVNNTKVFPARLIGRSETGARIEAFLVAETSDGCWDVLAKPAKRLHQGKRIIFDKRLSAVVIEKLSDGKVRLNFESDGDFYDILNGIGRTPLPPYIKRDQTNVDTDRERYQTVYAKERGAIAAPTAGLHFTPAMFDLLRNAGAEIAEITLHVGYGTFEPIRAEDLADHHVSPESYSISDHTADMLDRAKSEGRRIIAVGTTTTRALESSITATGIFGSGHSLAELTLRPGYKFRAVDALLTNFHLPQSSLLLLTSSFGGHGLIMDAYRHAVRERYRFYSYGDCMLIV